MKNFSDNLRLEELFRYLFSGIIFIGFIIYFYPESELVMQSNGLIEQLKSSWYIITLISLAIGVSFYVINRYTIMALLDYLFFILGLSSFTPANTNWIRRLSPKFYLNELSNFLKKRFATEIYSQELSRHLMMRRAQVHLLVFITELSIIGYYFGRKIFGLVPLILFIFMLVQQVTMERIEKKLVFGV